LAASPPCTSTGSRPSTSACPPSAHQRPYQIATRSLPLHDGASPCGAMPLPKKPCAARMPSPSQPRTTLATPNLLPLHHHLAAARPRRDHGSPHPRHRREVHFQLLSNDEAPTGFPGRPSSSPTCVARWTICSTATRHGHFVALLPPSPDHGNHAWPPLRLAGMPVGVRDPRHAQAAAAPLIRFRRWPPTSTPRIVAAPPPPATAPPARTARPT